MNTQKILIIDDEKDLSEALSEALKSEGYEVSQAGNGKEGLSMALSEHPDLILLDILMPEMDGHDLLKKLREDEWGKTAKVVVMTVLDTMDSVAEVLEEGVVDYVVKSEVSLVNTIEKVKEILGK